MVIKNLPESKFAVFNEKNGEEGSVTEKGGLYTDWFPKSNYNFNMQILGDFEVIYFDEKIEHHEIWIPVIDK
jgi:predicted transcriptional regulator YdeE